MNVRPSMLALIASLATGTAFAEGMSNPPVTDPGGGVNGSGATPPPGTGTTSGAPGNAPPRSTMTGDMAPMVLVVPTYFAMDPNVGNGCWARLFDKKDFTGTVFAMVGPVDIPSNRAGFITGFESGRNYDSVMVGPTASLTVWDRDTFQNKSTTFTAGEAIPDLDSRMGAMEEIRSMRLSCAR
jgi:hypothetical protein